MTPHERARAMLPDWVKRENDNALTAAWIEGYAAATAEHPPAPPFHEIARYGEADIGKQPAPIGRVWGSLPDGDEKESRPSGMPSIRDIVITKLEESGESGSKASAIREYIETTYAANIHVKTVGMTLYRLVKDGLARRDGRVWFSVPSSEKTEIPGAASSGADG